MRRDLESLLNFANATAARMTLVVNGQSIPRWSTGDGSLAQPGDYRLQSWFMRAALPANTAPNSGSAADGMPPDSHRLKRFDRLPETIRTVAGRAAGGGVAGVEVTERKSASIS